MQIKGTYLHGFAIAWPIRSVGRLAGATASLISTDTQGTYLKEVVGSRCKESIDDFT